MDGGVVSAPGAGPTPVPPRDAGANPTWALAVAAIYTLLALLLLPAALVGWRRLSKASDPAAAEDGALGSEEEEQAEPAAPPVPGPEAPDAGPAPAPPALPPLKLPPAVLYSSTAQTFVIGFKVAPLPAAMPGGSPPSEGGAEGAPPSPPSQPADSAALREAAALAANHLCGQAFAASAASVRNAAAAALVSVLQQNQLSVVNVQASTFPGCVHLVVSLQLPAGSDGSGRAVTPAPDAQQHLQRQLHAALQHQLSGAYKATISTPAGGAQQQLPYLHPVALPTTTTSDASSSSRVELVLPSSLIDQMRSAGQRLRVVVTPAVTAARLPAGRSQAWAQDLQPAAAAAAPQTDQRVDATFAAADAAPGPTASTVRVAVQVPASLRARVGGGSAQPLLQVHVLLRGEAGEQLLAQLPLPVLPPAACSELQLLFADMTAEMGGEAGSAHAASFAPLARDLALTQQPPQAGEAATAARPAAPSEAKAQQLRLAIIRGLLRFLTEQQRAAPACVQLAADAAQRYGLHHASLQVGRRSRGTRRVRARGGGGSYWIGGTWSADTARLAAASCGRTLLVPCACYLTPPLCARVVAARGRGTARDSCLRPGCPYCRQLWTGSDSSCRPRCGLRRGRRQRWGRPPRGRRRRRPWCAPGRSSRQPQRSLRRDSRQTPRAALRASSRAPPAAGAPAARRVTRAHAGPPCLLPRRRRARLRLPWRSSCLLTARAGTAC